MALSIKKAVNIAPDNVVALADYAKADASASVSLQNKASQKSTMAQAASPQILIGHASLNGPRQQNEDFCGAVTPEGTDLNAKGVVAAIADGLGGHENGREAAEYVVRGLLADFYATPETWSIPLSFDKVLAALNTWLLSRGQQLRQSASMACTLSALCLRGARYTTAHVGDSRIYLLRDGAMQKLTQDHVWDHPELSNVLKRAVGLDARLDLDFSEGALHAGDVFVLLTDGVWTSLPDATIAAIVAQNNDATDAAMNLTRLAVSHGAQDNCTAMVVRVLSVPEHGLRDSFAQAAMLPVPPKLRLGSHIDGLRVDEIIHDSRITVLYRVTRLSDGQPLVLKTLHDASDAHANAALVHEEWLTRRVTSHYFPQVIPHEARQHLYYLMTWHEGTTLGQNLVHGHHTTAAEAVQLGIRLLKGVAALHRLSILHRDIKPENLHLGTDKRLRILDLGVAASDSSDLSEINNPGTPSYMAPELLAGGKASVQSDLYACGITLYQILTRKFPYGEVEPFQHPKFGDPLPPTRFRPDLPAWLEAVLLRACARDQADRFETAEEFLLALERGASRPLAVPRRMPLMQRAPLLALKLALAASVLFNIALLFFVLKK